MSTEFSDDVTPSPAAGEETQQVEDYLSQFVGEGKAYTTVEEAASALAKKAVNADQFIETLKTEKQQLESQYTELQTRNKSIDEIVAALKQPETPTKTTETPSPVSVEDVLKKFKEEQAAESKETIRKQAVDSAWATLDEAFLDRDKAKAVVRDYIGGDESRKAVVDAMAVADPSGLANLLKATASTTNFTEDPSGQRPPARVEGTLTWEDANKIKKENPTLYYSPKFRKRMREELI